MSSKKLGIPSAVSSDVGRYKTSEEFERLGFDTPRCDGEWHELYLISKSFVRHIISRIDGTVMTLIESSTNDEEKRKSMKSIASRMIWQEAKDISLLRLKKIK